MSGSIHSIRYKDLWEEQHAPSPLSLRVSADTNVTIVSDCHLDKKFHQTQYNNLKKIIEESDQMIINGDFWADKHVTFDAFISSPWSQLFPLLKQKNTYYIFGNHDMPARSDDRIFLFCNQAGFQLKLSAGNLQFHIEHGHLLSKGLIRKTIRLFENYPRLLGKLTWPVGAISEPIYSILHFTKSTAGQRINKEFKTSRYSISLPHEYFVMGHTHMAEFDEGKKYLNSGRTHGGYFSYILIRNNRILLQSL